MFILRLVAFIFLAATTMANAQWVTSGSGMGARTGDQGLTNADGAAQSLGYANNAALEAASLLGYGATSEDGALWTAATSGIYDEDCRVLFGADCDELTDDIFRPQKPITQAALSLGFTGAIEQDAYLAVCGGLPDAQRCKQKGYEPTQYDASLCQMSVTDTDNLEFCQAHPDNASGDCSDLPRDDYEAVVLNNAPEIILPADWTPPSLSAGESPQSEIFQFRAVDVDNDPLTWSVHDTNGVFEINGQGMLSLAAALTMAGQNLYSAEVTVSDGIAFDTETVRFDVTRQNRPPQIMMPDGWLPPIIAADAGPGDSIISQLSASDPDNDALTWSITSTDYDVFQIDPQSAVVSLFEGGNVPEESPDSITLTVQVSDGELTDELTLKLDVEDPNSPPQIVLPADWMPSIVAHDAEQGTRLVDVLAAQDPDGDELTWSIAASDINIIAIDPQTGVLTLSPEDGLAGLEERPENISLTVQVSDGKLTDEQALVIPLEAEKVNNPPEIIVPAGFADNELAPYTNQNGPVGTLEGRDPDGDTLTWTLLEASPQIFTINAQTGILSHTAIGADDKLACAATSTNGAAKAGGGSSSGGQGNYPQGIVSVNANVFQDHSSSDFRSKRSGGSFSTSGKYHVVLERSNHRGGSFTTENRGAATYSYEGGSISVPALSATSVNSNLSPINSYLVFQNNSQADMRGVNGRVTFENPIVGIFYTDGGFDNTINSLGKPGAQYSRKYQQSKLGLEGGKDIAWIDPVDRRVLNFRSRTANIGDFLRVITTASSAPENGDDDNKEPAGPDTCTATLTVQLSDGQETDEETLTLAFADPNRGPQVFTPADWTPSTISNTTDAGALVIGTLGAVDPDGDILKWSLEGDNADLFSIGSLDGKIRLSQAYGEASSLPSKANVTVRVTDGRLSDTLALNIPIEKKLQTGSFASNTGTNGSFQFVSGDVQNIFNQDYTIMARFFHGSGGYSDPYFDYKKRKWLNRDAKETIFFWGGNSKGAAAKFLSGISLHVVGDTIRLQLGSDGSYLETRASIQRNRWHTVMFVVDADQRRKTKKHNWPVKMYLNGRRVGLNEFKFTSKNKGYKPIGTPEGNWPKQMASTSYTREVYVEFNDTPVAAIGVAGKVKPGWHWSDPERRHLPLRSSSFIHEVSIWQGDKSSVASGIYNNNRDVADYASTSIGRPRYSWKPGLLGQSKTEIHCGKIGKYWNYTQGIYTCRGTPDGDANLERHKDWTPGWGKGTDPKNFVIDRWKGTVTLANLANGPNPKNGKSDYVGPTAGNGEHRLDGDMHLYSGGFTFETQVYNKKFRKSFTGFVRAVPSALAIDACNTSSTVKFGNQPLKAWHQGGSWNQGYFSGLKKWHRWSAHCKTYNDDDIKAFAPRAMSGKTKPLN